jgi:hypothetical protein
MNLDQFWFFKQEGMIAHLILVDKSKKKQKACMWLNMLHHKNCSRVFILADNNAIVFRKVKNET